MDQLVVHQHVLPPSLVLQLLNLVDELLVVGQERQPGFPLTLHQCLTDEDASGSNRVDTAKVHASVVVDDDAIQRGALQRHHFAGLLFPVRLQQLGLQQVAGQGRYPQRVDGGQAAAIEPRGFHQLRRHQPTPGLLAEVCARVAPELHAASAQVPVLVFALAAQVAQQSRQHGLVQLLVAGRLGVEPPALLRHHRVQL